MSIPLDRLYHYIENVASDVYQSNVLIYRFAPHGSKKLTDLQPVATYDYVTQLISPQLFCHDQEPLNYNLYNDLDVISKAINNWNTIHTRYLAHNELIKSNIRYYIDNIYDKCILLHSEQRSNELKKYKNDQYIPVYYWSHAIIALDWFRYAQQINIKKSTNNKKQFLIYNRAWSGTREYRLKFIDSLINYNLLDSCVTWCNPIEPELQIHYTQYQFENIQWTPKNQLESHLAPTQASSCYSADVDFQDYQATDIEVVLETLFDDHRLHLTEKILRPIACGHPFILMGTYGSLSYLRSYGFKTFGSVIDESYDEIIDPKARMQAVIKLMKTISEWSIEERLNNMSKINHIAEYNKTHFFSKEFLDTVVQELKENLSNGLIELEQSNTGTKYINVRKLLAKNPDCRNHLTRNSPNRSRQDIAQVVKLAKSYSK